MNRNSNTYTFLYAAGLVVVVASALAIATIGLKEPQEKNIAIEKKLNILSTVGKGMPGDEITDRDTYIETQYDKYIVESFIVDGCGERKEGDAFRVNMKEEYDKIKTIKQTSDEAQQAALRVNLTLPVFVYKDDDARLKCIIPVYGTGLWGPLWGYVALNDDFNTVYGAIFDHKGETPGLGAEIATQAFAKQFVGKQIFDGHTLTSIKVVKGGAPETDLHGVDAISGGTITSRGVEDMLQDCLDAYEAFFTKNKK
ncbi:MAG: NADH:ubiquinone reductase (Na(+)-transporting) subunit C [Prevotellaceae bacterium]|jgi:Na+-transporting NADH:ubiquinone oxidoreductase subunit C|nr:NADH:ubiquinone reductase (Na(+)-transporting) subunit C [Prevotellaceae bacterium]